MCTAPVAMTQRIEEIRVVFLKDRPTISVEAGDFHVDRSGGGVRIFGHLAMIMGQREGRKSNISR